MTRTFTDRIGKSSEELKIALFAANDIGLEITRFFAKKGKKLSALILDANENKKRADLFFESAYADRIYLHTDPLSLLDADLAILCWWPYLIKEDILQLCARGFLNFHPSLLPYGRGKHPNFWTFVDQTPFGVTIHWVTKEIDGGPIAFQREIAKTWTDTGQSLYAKAKKEIVLLFAEHFEEILYGHIPCIQQPAGYGLHYAKELEPASQLDLDELSTVRDLLNVLRARTFPPWPGCRFCENGDSYQVRIEIIKEKEHAPTDCYFCPQTSGPSKCLPAGSSQVPKIS